MLSQSVEKVFAKYDESLTKQDLKLMEQRREVDLKLAEQRREFDERMKDTAKDRELQRREHRGELVAARRWTVGTIITVGLSLAAYLSALIHFNH